VLSEASPVLSEGLTLEPEVAAADSNVSTEETVEMDIGMYLIG